MAGLESTAYWHSCLVDSGSAERKSCFWAKNVCGHNILWMTKPAVGPVPEIVPLTHSPGIFSSLSSSGPWVYTYAYTHTHTHTHVHVYIHMHVNLFEVYAKRYLKNSCMYIFLMNRCIVKNKAWQKTPPKFLLKQCLSLPPTTFSSLRKLYHKVSWARSTDIWVLVLFPKRLSESVGSASSLWASSLKWRGWIKSVFSKLASS